MDKNLLFCGHDLIDNWFYNRYYYNGNNPRYHTFQIALNILNQSANPPTIIETGCQREEEDVGAGMSTSIFAEYISRYGGKLITVDNNLEHLGRVKSYLKKWPEINVEFVYSDSVEFLSQYNDQCQLLYLDSFDYPYGELLNIYGGKEDIDKAILTLNNLGRDEVLTRHFDIIFPCQEHCLKEFQSIESNLTQKTILLIDDCIMAGGGKGRILKDYLLENKQDNNRFKCLIDSYTSLWINHLL